MQVYNVSSDQLRSQNMSMFTNTIYHNFENLSQFPHLNHSKKSIHDLLTGESAVVYVCVLRKHIIGYIVGEIMQLQDGRNVLYITYLFVSKQYRNKKMASILIASVEKHAKNKFLNGIMLTCDTHNKPVYDMYKYKGFAQDIVLKGTERFDVMFKLFSY